MCGGPSSWWSKLLQINQSIKIKQIHFPESWNQKDKISLLTFQSLFAVDGKIPSLSKSNLKWATELIEVEWNFYFSNVSEMCHFHPNAHNRRLNIFQKASPHPVHTRGMHLLIFYHLLLLFVRVLPNSATPGRFGWAWLCKTNKILIFVCFSLWENKWHIFLHAPCMYWVRTYFLENIRTSVACVGVNIIYLWYTRKMNIAVHFSELSC